MTIHQYATLEDTVYFWFASNNTSGSGSDGASAASHVRLAGAAASAAPVISPTPALLTHASYPAGAYEVAVAATGANGFATNSVYSVFCTLAVDSQNPTGFIGSFALKPISANVIQVSGDATAADNLEADYDGTGYSKTASSMALNATTCNKIADHVLRRSFNSAKGSADGDTKAFRSLLGAVAKLVNKYAVSGSTLTIYEDDDSTALGTQTLTTSGSASPVTAADTV